MFVDPVSMALITTAPDWLAALYETLLSKDKDAVAEQGKKWIILGWTKWKELRHIKKVLKDAVRRGIVSFQEGKERDQYRDILSTLFKSGPGGDILRREALRLFTLSDTPNFAELNEIYNRALRTLAISQPTPSVEVNAVLYLNSFFKALIDELYEDEVFGGRVSKVLGDRAAKTTQEELPKITQATEKTAKAAEKILKIVDRDYSEEQFLQDKKAYIQWLEQKYRILKLNIVSHLLEKGAFQYKDPDISTMFVPFQAKLNYRESPIPPSVDTVTELLLNLRKQAERWSSKDIPRHLILLGGPGQGKSTLIQHLVWSHAAANLPQPSTSAANVSLLPWNPIPLHIDLSQISKFKRTEQDNFLSCIIKILQTQGVKVQNTHQMFERILEQEESLLLFDGLDETTQDRQFVIEGIEELARSYPKSTILVTSRIIGYYTRRLSTVLFSDAEIQSFDKSQIHLFLKNWYKYVLRSLQQDTELEQELFYDRLVHNPRLYTLAANPLLLTIMAALYHLNPKALPDKRVQIYEQCARTLLEHWAKVRGSSMEREALVMSGNEQYLCAAQLGYEIHQYAQRSEEETGTRRTRNPDELPSSNVSAEFIQRKIENFLKDRYPSISWSKQAEAFFELMQLDAGLIIKRGTDEIGAALYGFVHRTFQEYFAAVYIYKCYHKDDNPNPVVISDFIRDCLHDPYWNEVTLLLFEKLEPKAAIEQLDQIFEGKIKSRRSLFTDIVQQDLFFVCEFLSGDIVVDEDLAEKVVSRLSNLVKNSPFPSQSERAIETLVSLVRTQNYASLARRELKVLTTQYITLDRLKIQANQDRASLVEVDEWLLDNQVLLNLLEQSNTPYDQAMQAAQILCQINPFESKEQQQATQMLLKLVQRLDLSTEQIISVAKFLYEKRPYKSEEWQQATQMLFNQAQKPDLSIRQKIDIVQTLFESPPKSNEWEQATRLLLKLAQQTNLSIEQIVEIAEILYCNSPRKSEGEKKANQMILDMKEQSNMSIDKAVQVIQTLCQANNLQKWRQAMETLIDLGEQPNIPAEEAVLVAQTLIGCSQEWAAWLLISDLLQRPNLSIEQSVLIAQTLYDCNPFDKSLALGKNKARELLSPLEQRSDLSIEQSILVAEAINKCYPNELQGKQRARQLLLSLAQRSDPSTEQLVQIAEAFQPYRYRLLDTEDIEYISQLLRNSIESTDLSFEQLVRSLKVLYHFSYHNNEVQQYAYQKLSQLVQGSELLLNQRVEIVCNLYQYSDYQSSERQQIAQQVWQIAQDERLTNAQRLSVLEPILEESQVDYEDKVKATRIVNALLREEQAKQYLKAHWHTPFSGENVRLVDIPYMIELVSQKLLPTEELDRMYRPLDRMVPKFDKIPAPIGPQSYPSASRSPFTTLNSPSDKRETSAGFVHGYALIVGVADYADSRIAALYEEVVKDAMEMHNVLRTANLSGYPNDHVKLLYDNARDKAATLANIRDHLSWLAQAANADGDATAIFYFSGHGERIEIDGQVSYYLYPYDCNADDLESTALTGQELSQLLRAIQAPRLLVILDSCYSGGIDGIKGPHRDRAIFKGEPHEDDYRQLAQGQGRVIIASSRPSETSRALPDLNNSLFTHYLVEALRGKAHSHGDGLLRVNDVFNYASAQVSQHRPQHPVITSHASENFPIALYLGGKQTASSSTATDSVDLTALREGIVRAFSLEELRTLCADVTQALLRDGKDELIRLDLLEGSGLRAKAQSLVEYCERRGYLSYLITEICRIRPNLDICKQAK